jgi:3-methyladenine DNA glycosylase AlkD
MSARIVPLRLLPREGAGSPRERPGGGPMLVETIRAALRAHADKAKAPAMQAYMKSTMPFLGVPRPVLDRIVIDAVKLQPLASTGELIEAMAALWRHARFREERYAAIELPTCSRAHRVLIAPALLPLVEEMIVTGAWWDHVDDLSGNVLAELLRAYPADVKPRLSRWAKGGDMWLRRAAMLCQRKLRGADFDAVLFYETVVASVGPKARFADEFFIRKGIGWALRERSCAAPDEVAAFCREYDAQLSPLTKREALRVIAKRAAARR